MSCWIPRVIWTVKKIPALRSSPLSMGAAGVAGGLVGGPWRGGLARTERGHFLSSFNYLFPHSLTPMTRFFSHQLVLFSYYNMVLSSLFLSERQTFILSSDPNHTSFKELSSEPGTNPSYNIILIYIHDIFTCPTLFPPTWGGNEENIYFLPCALSPAVGTWDKGATIHRTFYYHACFTAPLHLFVEWRWGFKGIVSWD